MRASQFAHGLVLTIAVASSLRAAAPDYDRDIRPILSDRCFVCHGPDAEQRQAELRLDTFEGLTEHVVVPGKPEESELVARITGDDESLRMPPSESNLALSAAEIELLRAWIAAGAEVTPHWAFRPLPAVTVVPTVNDNAWPRSELDRFVLARLELEGLTPSPAADPLRLLRRLTLDLTGLPPSVEDIAEFRKAAELDRDAAIAAAVDRLLASPAYGEHMAVAWLDAARYADSYGYQSDQLNPQWPYRDWVVRAFNANMKYDEFLTQQLAGDLLPGATRDQRLATAFNRLHRLTNEGGSIAEEWLAENAADRVHTFGMTVLGLTLECARCHDHKYDPISQRDYYSLAAFFNSIDENGLYDNASKTPSPSLLLPTAEQEQQLELSRNEVAEAEAAMAQAIADGEPRFQAWLQTSTQPPPDVDLVRHVSFDEPDVAAEMPRIPGVRGNAVQFDGDRSADFADVLAIDRWQPFTIAFWIRDDAANPQPVVVVQQTRGTDVGYNGFDLMLAGGVLEARLYRVWPGNAIGVRARRPLAPKQWQHVVVSYDGSSRAEGLRLYLDGVELPTRIVRDRIRKSASVAGYGGGELMLGARFRDRGFKDGAIDELHVYSRDLTPLEVADRFAEDRESVAPDESTSAANDSALREFYFSAIDAEVREQRDAVAAARRRLIEAEEPIHEVAVMEELPTQRPAYILARGAYDAPKSAANRVGRDTFAELAPPFPDDAPRDRRGLAQWVTDPSHPLTARVLVNRLWANFFGRGLVATPENFGRQGAAPSHPELLDWLARDFVAHGWDVKRLCRQIVSSATYQQDSRASLELRVQDPENVLLARGPSRRLSGEQIRDLALAASNLLDRTLGGPPVSPYQPGGDLWREVNTMSPAYQQSTGTALHRRSLYSVWKRTAPLPNMLAFDAATREVCTVSRSRTNTPLQALVLMNDVQFIEAARVLAAAVARDATVPRAQVAAAFTRLAGRDPDEIELELLIGAYFEQLVLFSDNEMQHAASFLNQGEAPLGAESSSAELAALAATCQIIMNLDATIYER
jgi:hypothetical protein